MLENFIAIEGIDGSGKETQTRRLVQRSLDLGLKARSVSFPNYKTKIGKEIRRYLDGGYGSLDKVDPKFASLLYMMNRQEAQMQLWDFITYYDLVFSDRYAPSNFGHQGAKFARGAEREDMLNWLMRFEYDVVGNLKPGVVVYLDIPPGFSDKAMENERRKKDIHEADMVYQEMVRETFLDLALQEEWIVIDCLKDSETRFSVEEITNKIWEELAKCVPVIRENNAKI